MDNQLKKNKLEPKNLKNSMLIELQNEIMEQVNSDVEEVQMQINSLRSQLKTKEKKQEK